MSKHGEFSHIEFPADDVERAKSFYANVFDWSFRAMAGVRTAVAVGTGTGGTRYLAYFGDVKGNVVAFFIIALAAAEAAVGLAILVGLYRTRQTVNLDDASLMRR